MIMGKRATTLGNKIMLFIVKDIWHICQFKYHCDFITENLHACAIIKTLNIFLLKNLKSEISNTVKLVQIGTENLGLNIKNIKIAV